MAPDAAPPVARPGHEETVVAVLEGATTAKTTAGYGGLVTRVIAAALDALLINLAALAVAGVVALVLSIFPVSSDMRHLLAAVGGVLFTIWVAAYFVTFWTTTGQTPGGRVMRVQVVRREGGPLTPWRALWRLAAAILGLVLFLGYVPILLDARRRGFHDRVAGTVVLSVPDQPRR